MEVTQMTSPIHNYSEIGKLKTVLLKRPGREIENFTPEMMPRLLFDDIPYLPIAQKEHDYFADTLRDNGVEVLYLEKLSAEALDAGGEEVRDHFLEQMLTESGYASGTIHDALKEYLGSMSNQDMVVKIMAGVRKNELDFVPKDLVSCAENQDYEFYMDPMPNLYFTRDPSACIGDGLSINHMTYPARQRESLFNETIIKYHPRFANQGVHVWRDRNHTTRIEGGDELVLNDHVMAIGVSQRTSADAIQDIAKNLFAHGQYDTVIAIKIPHNHAMMHLDTVFTMINYDQFTVHPGILGKGGQIDTWTITPGQNKGELNLQHDTDLKKVLKAALHLDDLDLIPTGNGDPIIAGREQWNDGSNTLAIAPGVVVTYNRNYVSNELLRKHGLKVLEVISSELSRGRGGPRCMSCPIVREDLKK
ncbi:arginine deiminase (ADI) (arginine dihydrolase) (AD) [Lentilactobacillus farraginis DSM 18382 = JCM 14108]|uniref:Arginine deiminase n=2 Tax=Lentilactobacillus farraginis DSM 18382 = JCM 14108 TaxID=1423743 RepID=A0A0R1VP63_9LACO|nr:arginine deiminase (ADI) (arginine dihydrolase) (AD) [Lentilactobacillus farraginis DSM 18382 = JCM 14108]